MSKSIMLSNDRIRSVAPSVFAEAAHSKMSGRYRQIPTIEVVDMLRDQGFEPVRAAQSVARLADRTGFMRHMIRFRHRDLMNMSVVGTEFPELVLTNSHDGSSAYQFSAGIYRLVCGNGMVVSQGEAGGISVRHSGASDLQQRVLDATFKIVEHTPKVLESVTAWKQLQLTGPVQKEFAAAAAIVLDNSNVPVDSLLTSRRYEDRRDANGNRSLWNTLNAVQENVIKGGVKGVSPKGRRSTSRPVKSVDRDIKLNKALWTLADRMAQIMGV